MKTSKEKQELVRLRIPLAVTTIVPVRQESRCQNEGDGDWKQNLGGCYFLAAANVSARLEPILGVIGRTDPAQPRAPLPVSCEGTVIQISWLRSFILMTPHCGMQLVVCTVLVVCKRRGQTELVTHSSLCQGEVQ